MVKVIDFLKMWGILLLSLIIFLRTCTLSSKVEKLSKDTKEDLLKLDSLIKLETLSKEEFQKMLTIEGLKSEKRMIQSTDRKLLDVTRQSEIDKELQKLEGK
jgi:hypothetical protein